MCVQNYWCVPRIKFTHSRRSEALLAKQSPLKVFLDSLVGVIFAFFSLCELLISLQFLPLIFFLLVSLMRRLWWTPHHLPSLLDSLILVVVSILLLLLALAFTSPTTVVFGVFGYSAQPTVTKFARLIVAVCREIGKLANTAVWWRQELQLKSWCEIAVQMCRICEDIHWWSVGGSLALVCVFFCFLFLYGAGIRFRQ